MSTSNEQSTLGTIFGWGGAILGFFAGMNTGEIGPAIVGAIIFGCIGFIIGRFVEWVVARVIFVGILIVMFAISPLGRFVFAAINHMTSNGS